MIIGIVADDLTGAADAVAPFAQQGRQAVVKLFPWRAHGLETVEALAQNTATRDALHQSDTLRASLVRRATRHLQAYRPGVIFKKIDSTLRGALRLELDAMRRELPGRVALICPAFPANGRTVRQGVLHVDGVPWTQTAFCPTHPERLASPTVRTAFEADRETSVLEIDLPLLRQGVEALETRIAATFAPEVIQRPYLSTERHWDVHNAPLIFCDAETPEDMQILAELVLRHPERYLPVGSAGFARALAERLPLPEEARGTTDWPQAALTQGNVLAVIGSRNPVSRRQRDFLARSAGVEPIPVTWPRWQTGEAKHALRAHWAAGHRIAILTSSSRPCRKNPVGPLCDVALQGFRATDTELGPKIDALILTGGETALPLLQQIGAPSAGNGLLQILGESEPGVVRALLPCANGSALPVVIKAGGFGTDETLARLVGLA